MFRWRSHMTSAMAIEHFSPAAGLRGQQACSLSVWWPLLISPNNSGILSTLKCIVNRERFRLPNLDC